MFGCLLVLQLAGGESNVLQTALDTAVDDIRRSLAMYEGYVANHGRVRPFPWIIRQKRRQERQLVRLADKRGLSVPPVLWDAKSVRVPGQRVEACSQAINHELRNVAIYERALELWSGYGSGLFRRLRTRARHKHLPAFERCVRWEN